MSRKLKKDILRTKYKDYIMERRSMGDSYETISNLLYEQGLSVPPNYILDAVNEWGDPLGRSAWSRMGGRKEKAFKNKHAGDLVEDMFPGSRISQSGTGHSRMYNNRINNGTDNGTGKSPNGKESNKK